MLYNYAKLHANKFVILFQDFMRLENENNKENRGFKNENGKRFVCIFIEMCFVCRQLFIFAMITHAKKYLYFLPPGLIFLADSGGSSTPDGYSQPMQNKFVDAKH